MISPLDTSLFDNTLEYNIKFGNQDASDEEVQDVINRCKLRDAVNKLPLGLQTPVGERGARLSGGERQKVAIARALLRQPGVILCDEITSSVDAFAEKDIVNTIREACGIDDARCDVTVITVAHRLSSIMHCDKIFVMDRGVLLEQGSHQELLDRPGSVYGRMWRSQRGEESMVSRSSSSDNSSSSSSSTRIMPSTVIDTSSTANAASHELATANKTPSMYDPAYFQEGQIAYDESDYFITGFNDA
jgi:ABC-type protease/lipase transport system fused ATPase/permease subunit